MYIYVRDWVVVILFWRIFLEYDWLHLHSFLVFVDIGYKGL